LFRELPSRDARLTAPTPSPRCGSFGFQ